MKGIILAAGYGERLRPKTNSLPKPLFLIGSTTMVRNAIGYLGKYGITDISINLHHLGWMIKHELSSGLSAGVRLNFVEETVLMGTGGGIKGAESFIGDSDFVVVNSDVLSDLDLSLPIRFHNEKKALATLVVRENPDPSVFGVLEAAPDGRLAGFLGTRAPWYDENLRYRPVMFTGIGVFSSRFFGFIPAGRSVNISVEVYPLLVGSGADIYLLEHGGYWADIGTHEAYEAACRDVREGKFIPNGA